MTHLKLALLGSFQLVLQEPAAMRLESDKARGLLAFLAVEHDCAHSRAALAEFLWPGYSEHAAAANLRRVLANLRTVLDDRDAPIPHLRITRTTVRFELASDAFVDAVRLRDLLKTPASALVWTDHMEEAIALYRGPFLEGFTLHGCPEFEQWVVGVRSELDGLVSGALCGLAEQYYNQGDVAGALALYRRSLLLDPYHEAVHRQIMLAYAAAGQRKEVQSHYEAYKRQLQDELGARPEAQTTALYKALQAGRTVQIESASFREAHTQLALLPADLNSPARKYFVGREQELMLMHECAGRAASNHGGTLLIVGDAGSGKTALLYEFARRLAGAQQPWRVAIGASTAIMGVGDPYQPVLDALRMLVAGEAGVRQLFSSPETLRLLKEEAPDRALLAFAESTRQNGAQLLHAVPSQTTSGTKVRQLNNQANGSQIAFFDQLTHFLIRLARHAPLLLAMDNLHRADAGTIALIYHLTQRLDRGHVLIAGAYRPGALALERGEYGKLVGQTIYELRRHPTTMSVDLDKADGRRFTDGLLDRTPNRFGESFRAALYQHTEGHALFTVEMIHALAECGALSQDRDGCWSASEVIDWNTLPPHVEALIGERIDRLLSSDRRLLEAACVQGDEFSAQVAAAVSRTDDHLAVERLSGDLATAHRIVAPSNRNTDAGASDLRYRFRHHLFQAYLYNALDEGHRAWLHRAVGSTLEQQYAQENTASAATPQVLAWHFTQAGEYARAVGHLRAASQNAMSSHAYLTAVDLLTQALAFTPKDDYSAHFELLAVREQAHMLLRDQQARAQDVSALERVAYLTQQLPHQLVATLRSATLAEETTHYWEAITTANAALKLAVAAGDRAAQVAAHLVAGRAHWWRGEVSLAHSRYSYALHSAKALEPSALIELCRLHVGIAAWSLGDMAGADAAFSELLRNATHPEQLFLRGAALMGSGMVACARREYGRAEGLLDSALSLARQLHHPWLEGQVLLNQVALYRLSMHCADCLALYPQLLQHCQAIDDRWTTTAAQMEIATLYVQLGAWEKARETIDLAMVTADTLSTLLLKLRLRLLRFRLSLGTGEAITGVEVDQALDMANRLGVASLLVEVWLISALVQQRQGHLVEAAASLVTARAIARDEASQSLLAEVVCAQAQLSLALGDGERALGCVAELVGNDTHLSIEQAMDPSSLYMTCYTVLNAVGEPWAEQMLVRGRRCLEEQASLITDEELQQAFRENIAYHRTLLTIPAAPTLPAETE